MSEEVEDMNIEYRPIRNTDYDLLSTPFTEASVADGRLSRQVGEEVREEFESLPVDLEAQTISAWRGGQLAGAACVYHLPRRTVRECRRWDLVHAQTLHTWL